MGIILQQNMVAIAHPLILRMSLFSNLHPKKTSLRHYHNVMLQKQWGNHFDHPPRVLRRSPTAAVVLGTTIIINLSSIFLYIKFSFLYIIIHSYIHTYLICMYMRVSAWTSRNHAPHFERGMTFVRGERDKIDATCLVRNIDVDLY